MRLIVRGSLFLCTVVLLTLGISPLLAQDGEEVLTVYSGRSESLIGPILEQFTAETGIQVQVLYGDTAGVANQILEEGTNSPADVFIAQDAGALGALANAGLLSTLSSDIVERVDAPFVSPEAYWVALSARARVLVYNPEALAELGLELPASLLDLTNEEWRGHVGWAPTNASFQAQVTAIRILLGEEAAQAWLEDMVANDPVTFDGNTPIVQAVINGEIPLGIVNHYYLFRFLAENPSITTRNYYLPGGDVGALVNIAGAGVLETSDQKGLGQRLVLYLLGNDAQQYFADNTFEYPVIDGITTNELLTPLAEIQTPELDLTDIDDLEGTLELIEASGALD